jgi:hypothetical protein
MGNNPYVVENLLEALRDQLIPTITFWNRLESRPRTLDFSRALKAEVHDALWMITKQWQMGEFRGDDAGSPINARIATTTSYLDKYQPSDKSAIPFPKGIPLEAIVERRGVPPSRPGIETPLDIRLQMGRQWLKMIKDIGEFSSFYIREYPFPDPQKESDPFICAHPEVRAQFAAVTGRAMDGAALYSYLENSSNHAYDKIPEIPQALYNKIDDAAKIFTEWFKKLYCMPSSTDDAWDPSRLEYQFACSGQMRPGERVYSADEYCQGHLDWYNLDIDPTRKTLNITAAKAGPATGPPPLRSFIPSTITFDGMPNTRWWTFEDGRTNFGDIRADTTDLAKLLLIEFGLVYANDWFLFPLKMDLGSISNIDGLVVTNVFGERVLIEPAGKGEDDDWQRWNMFTANIKGEDEVPADMSMLLLPTIHVAQESQPLEKVMFVRDEVANMVWGIETIVPLADGNSKPGGEAANELTNYIQMLINQNTNDGTTDEPKNNIIAPIRYKLMDSVPENWIPFIPVHVEGDIRETQLQRAAMLRTLKGDADSPPIPPRTMLLREGFPKGKYFLHEEEVPRAGIIVTQSFQRTRWLDGQAIVWLGVRKQTGRGEASSGLKFDQIIPAE